MSARQVVFTIAADPPPRLDKALSRDVPDEAALSRTRLARLIEEGAVLVDGSACSDARAKVSEGAEITILLPAPEDSHILPEDIPLDIVFEDDALIVVNKPPGMVVHPAPGTPSGTLVNALLHHFDGDLSGVGGVKRPGIVHRIDKDTSGLLVVAKSDAAHHALAAQFKAHTAERAYQAICYGVPDAADPRLRGLRGVRFEPGNTLCLTTQLARHKTDRQKQAVVFEQGRHAVTRVNVVAPFGAPPTVAQITCRLETGRTHQIRVHLAYAGHGLVGDPTYGGARKLPVKSLSPEAADAVRQFPRQALHAAVLGFIHPETGQNLHFEAPMPEDMQNLITALKSA